MRSFNYFPTVTPDDDCDIADLVAYVRPFQALVDWYDRLVNADRAEPDISELDETVVDLTAVRDLAGQLGLSAVASNDLNTNSPTALAVGVTEKTGTKRRPSSSPTASTNLLEPSQIAKADSHNSLSQPDPQCAFQGGEQCLTED